VASMTSWRATERGSSLPSWTRRIERYPPVGSSPRGRVKSVRERFCQHNGVGVDNKVISIKGSPPFRICH
jgi:hypothetical protein